MGSRNPGKLAAFTLFGVIAALVVAAIGDKLGIPWWVGTIVVVAFLFAVAWALRRQETGRWSYERRSWIGEQDGRSVELVFDEKLVILNRLALIVDGEQVDDDTIFYGTKQLAGAGVTVEVGSGWVGQCTGAVLRGASDEERSLSERAPH